MKNCYRLVCPLLLLSVAALGAPCSTATFDTYLGSTFSCTIDDLLFSDFSFSSLNGGGAGPIAAADVLVTPVTGGFTFQGAFDAGPNQHRDILLGFVVSSLNIISGSTLAIGPVGATGTGNVTVSESQCLNGVFQPNGLCSSGDVAGLFVYANSLGASSSNTVVYTSAVTSVDVLKDIAVSGGTSGVAQFSLLSNTFDNGGGGPGLVPEPGGMAMLGSLLLVGSLLIRRGHKG
jgi:hypothetical protein